MAAWWESWVDPTDIRGIFVFSFFLYILSFLYESYVTPYVEGFVDLDKRTKDRIIKNRTERDRKEKEQEAARLLREAEGNNMHEIPEEDEQDEGDEQEGDVNIEKKKNKKKKNKTKKKEGGQKVKTA